MSLNIGIKLRCEDTDLGAGILMVKIESMGVEVTDHLASVCGEDEAELLGTWHRRAGKGLLVAFD